MWYVVVDFGQPKIYCPVCAPDKLRPPASFACIMPGTVNHNPLNQRQFSSFRCAGCQRIA